MKISLITVGTTKTACFLEGENHYIQRLRHYSAVESKSVLPAPIKPSTDTQRVLQEEADRILRVLPESNCVVIALDRKGESWSSLELADRIQEWLNRSVKRSVWIVGGAVGLGERVIKRSDYCFSLSKMTFPHEMVPVILLEQLYRSFTLIRGEKYHK
ncbi:MAG TPA: 23S rRNA (pseudouridine(1915)-N(3))-methyltransferase RlmH [bacterium]|nr:23S rRNA (pseudouridine(1915)-N(3))-methyltransferase RlmH [bacterium]